MTARRHGLAWLVLAGSLLLSGCAKTFPLTAAELNADLAVRFPVGTPYDVIETALTAEGYRGSGILWDGFSFDNLTGVLGCGHVVSGVVDERRRLKAIKTTQGCYRAIAP